MYRFTLYIFLLLICDRCYGVIYHLNGKKFNSDGAAHIAYKYFTDSRPNGSCSKGMNELPMRLQKYIDNNETEYEKMPSLFELENYELCLDIPEAVYCVASLELYGDSNNKIYHTIREYSQQRFKHFNYSTIERGVCVTKTCEKYMQKFKLDIKDDLEHILEGCLNETMKEKYDLSTRMYRLNCDKATEEQINIDMLDYTVAILFVILLAFIIIGSFYDLQYNTKNNGKECAENKQNNVLLCFSVFRNTERLKSEPNIDERLLELKGLYGVKTISQILVVFGHSLFTLSGFVRDPHTLEKAYESKFRIIFSASSLIQLYFFMTGFLMTYYLQIYSEKKKISWRDIPSIIFNRWWKLTAPLTFVIAFIATWFRHIGSGPLWKYFITNGVTAQCRDYYWAHFFYFNNFMQDDRLCLLQTWHLAVDFQLFIIGLIIYFMIRNRNWKIKCATLLFFLAIGTMSPIFDILIKDIDGVLAYSPEIMRTLKDRNLNDYHVLVQNNLSCFIMGMSCAYLGYYLKQRKIELRNFKLGNIMCWLSTPILIGLFQTMSLSFETPLTPAPLFTIIFAATHRFVIGLVASVWTLGVILKFNGLSQALFEWRGFEVMGKLTYGVFLLNIDVYNFLTASRTHLMPVSFLNLFFIFIGAAFICNLLAYVLYLLVEAPACQLFNICFRNGPAYKKNE